MTDNISDKKTRKRSIRVFAKGSTDTEKFWSRVNKNGPTMPNMDTPCWEWIAGRNYNYGILSVNKKTVRAHVYSYTLANGEFESGLCVLHRCDNRPCVRPDHLFLGTHADNVRDKVKKGRQAKGERAYATKLTACEVIEMRKIFAAGQVSQRALARQYGITPQSAYRVLRRLQWRHV